MIGPAGHPYYLEHPVNWSTAIGADAIELD